MSELKKKINYTVVCVNEFANKLNIAEKEAFDYLYKLPPLFLQIIIISSIASSMLKVCSIS